MKATPDRAGARPKGHPRLVAEAEARIIGAPYAMPKLFFPALIGGIALVSGKGIFALPWVWRIGGIVICLVGGLMLTTRVVIDCAKREVYEEIRLFNRRVLRKREFPFTDFDAIIYKFKPSEGGNETFVGLRFRSGRRVWIRTFEADNPRPRFAEEFAWRLSCDTGIEIDETV